MSLTIDLNFKLNGIVWQSGHVYRFRYNAWQHDPEPTLILLYRIRGYHPTTGHEWRVIQGINLSYVPRTFRKIFAATWVNEYEYTNGNTQFTWERVKRQFPYIEMGIRRYMYKPTYYIQNPEEVPYEMLEDVIIDTWAKDFSKKVKIDLMRKYNAVKKDVKKHNLNPFGKFLNKIFRGRG